MGTAPESTRTGGAVAGKAGSFLGTVEALQAGSGLWRGGACLKVAWESPRASREAFPDTPPCLLPRPEPSWLGLPRRLDPSSRFFRLPERRKLWLH